MPQRLSYGNTQVYLVTSVSREKNNATAVMLWKYTGISYHDCFEGKEQCHNGYLMEIQRYILSLLLRE